MEDPVAEPAEQPKLAEPPKPTRKKSSKHKTHVCNRNISLTEDHFGIIYDDCGRAHHVKRFTWNNHNKIQVQIITYGARITSISIPNRDGVVDDVVLGCDDIAGYLYYEDRCFGATLGRVADRIENSTFVIDGKQYWLTNNDERHHKNGGFVGFDKVIWKHYVSDTKVMLSHISKDKHEGYPGDLFVQITFELTPKNEFKVQMKATTTKPTVVNLTNLVHFNLAGHYAGVNELYKHTVTLNSNCYTKTKENGLPDGKIMNVVNTNNDFMIPKFLKDLIGIEPDDGYNQNFCVNRGVDQELCFVARVLHTPSGRIMEVYSDQHGVNFSTANDLGEGLINIPIVPRKSSCIAVQTSATDPFDLVNKLHSKMQKELAFDKNDNYSELRGLIRKLHKKRYTYPDMTMDEEREIELELHVPVDEDEEEENETHITEELHKNRNNSISGDLRNLHLTLPQLRYLDCMQGLSLQSITDYSEIKAIAAKILAVTDEFRESDSNFRMRNDSRVSFKIENNGEMEGETHEDDEAEREEAKKFLEEMERKALVKMENKIPLYYQDGRIHGKGNVIYKRHCALALQTQNYPNAIYHKNFPNCILRPGETYTHTVVYKFWNQLGNPSTWLRRYARANSKHFPAKM